MLTLTQRNKNQPFSYSETKSIVRKKKSSHLCHVINRVCEVVVVRKASPAGNDLAFGPQSGMLFVEEDST